jgi:hypothetical protein
MSNARPTEGAQIGLTDEETEALKKFTVRERGSTLSWVSAVAAVAVTYAILTVRGHEDLGTGFWLLCGMMAVGCWLIEERRNVVRGILRAYERGLRAPVPPTQAEVEDRLTIKEADALHSYLSVKVRRAGHWTWGAVGGFLLIPAGLVMALRSIVLHADSLPRLAFLVTFLGMLLAAVSFHFMDRATVARIVQKYDAALRQEEAMRAPNQGNKAQP